MDSIATTPMTPTRDAPGRLRAPEAVAALLLAAALGWAYAPNFAYLASYWENDPSYSYGWLVIPIALGFLWHRWDQLDRTRLAPNPWGWLALAAILGARALLYHLNQVWVESATIPAAAAALALALGGWHLLRWAGPSVAFLTFLLPLPPSLNTVLAEPLQRLATWGSTSVLQVMGLPALSEGTIVFIGANQLEVERACNGLSMLLAFVALIVATAILIERPALEKGVLLASAVPIALISNILRIVLTAYAYHQIGPNALVLPRSLDPQGAWTVGKLSHDAAGWGMMPIALALVWAELRLLSWLVVEDDDRPMAPVMSPPR